MKIINAFWEKRNLDMDCIEIVVEDTDKVESVSDFIDSKLSMNYIVVKVPVSRMDVNELLTHKKFVFREVLINMKLEVKNQITLNSLQKRIDDSIVYTEMNSVDLKELYSEVSKNIFHTDRISLDNNFSYALASKRYVHWIEDELKLGAKAYKVEFQEKSIGFFILKKINNEEYYPFLSGLYTDYLNSGLGFIIISKTNTEIFRLKAKVISTVVSSNNPKVVRVLQSFGYEIISFNYIYTKYN